MRNLNYKQVIFVAVAVLHGIVTVAAYLCSWIDILWVTALPWAIPITMISMLVVHAGSEGSLLTLTFLASILNSLLIFFYGLTRQRDV